jgi:hypothetical protein
MTASHPHAALILGAIHDVSPERLQKAVCGLADGSLTVTITRQTEADIRGLVKNSEGHEYGVILTGNDSLCSCKDALYRGVVCKHAVALALYALRETACAECDSRPARLNDGTQAPLCESCWTEREHRAAIADRPGVAQPWPAEPQRVIHLALSSGNTLCGADTPERFWRWPHWPQTRWAETCLECWRIKKEPALAVAA